MNTRAQINTNHRTSDLLEVWKYVSKKLRPKARNDDGNPPLVAAAVLAGEYRAAWMDPEERKEILGENSDDYKKDFLNEVNMDTLMHILYIHPVPDSVVERYGKNPIMDSVAKKTWARWKRWGDEALWETVPVAGEVEIIEKEMAPVVDALAEWAKDDKEGIVDTMRSILSTQRRRLRPEEYSFHRITPELDSYLTKSQISQLAPELRALAIARIPGNWDEQIAPASRAFMKKLDKFKHVLDEQGLDPDDVLSDATNYDSTNPKYQRCIKKEKT